MTAIRRTASGELAPDSFPRWFLLGAAALVLFSLASVGLVRLTGNGPDQRRAAEPSTSERPLRFEDRPDGSIAVVDGRTGQLVASVQGEQGFLRGALRALSRERKARGLGPEQPFQLIARPDGRLTLVDPVTDQRIDLESFGPTNAGKFATLLEPPHRP
ncbi:MAG: photosynthetic complex assembly protein PuhC [Betaproteobacteria bacterium]|jgi:putative photosynthetic complex assembly protein